MAVQAGFIRAQWRHEAVFHAFFVFHKIKTFLLVAHEGGQCRGLPRVGLVFRPHGRKTGDAETGQRRGDGLRDLARHVGRIDLDEPFAIGGGQSAFRFGQPGIGGAGRPFLNPDAPVDGVPRPDVHKARKERSCLQESQFAGVLVFSSHGPVIQGEEKQAPQQNQGKRKFQSSPGWGHGCLDKMKMRIDSMLRKTRQDCPLFQTIVMKN